MSDGKQLLKLVISIIELHQYVTVEESHNKAALTEPSNILYRPKVYQWTGTKTQTNLLGPYNKWPWPLTLFVGAWKLSYMPYTSYLK